MATDEALTGGELRHRARAGVFIVGTRGLVILLLGVAGNIVVARLLPPRDFGIVAIGTTFVLFTSLISDGGLGVGLIRRAAAPTAEELGALSALQLGATAALALAAAGAAVPFGRVGWVTAIMVASMPLVALQLPGRILLERSLRYRRLAAVEIAQVTCYQVFAIGTVAAGADVWGLAGATVVRAAAGAAVMAWACPAGLVRPRMALGVIRPLLGFGVRFQAVDANWMLRDQALNAAVGAISGLAPLGLVVLARRLLEVPFLLFQALWRVSFPTMSRLVTEGADLAPLVRRAAAMTAVGTGFLLAALAGSAPGLIPGVFGARWQQAAVIMPGACLGLAVGGSVSVAAQGYLYAVGDASAVLRGALAQTVTLLALALPLLPVLGIGAVGVGWAASSAAEAVVLSRATARRIGVRLLRTVLVPVAVGAAAAAGGWAVSVRAGADLRSGLLGAACTLLLYVLGLAVVDRPALRGTYSFAGASVRSAFAVRDGSLHGGGSS